MTNQSAGESLSLYWNVKTVYFDSGSGMVVLVFRGIFERENSLNVENDDTVLFSFPYFESFSVHCGSQVGKRTVPLINQSLL